MLWLRLRTLLETQSSTKSHQDHCERTKLMICHRKAFKCHKWLGVWCLRCCPWPDMAKWALADELDIWNKKLVVVCSDGAKCSEPTMENMILSKEVSKKRSNTLIICNSQDGICLSVGLKSTAGAALPRLPWLYWSPIFFPRHPSHILESEAASKDKHDKPRERERERQKHEILLFVWEA